MTKPEKPGGQDPGLYGDDDDAALDDLQRIDFFYATQDRATFGKPRYLALKGYDNASVRIVPPINYAEHASRRGANDRRDRYAIDRLIDGLSEAKGLGGPASSHAVDELAAGLFADAPNFAPAIQAIRTSATTHIGRGARWLQFRPTIIQSEPGAGKTRLAHRLAALSSLPMIYLDCSLPEGRRRRTSQSVLDHQSVASLAELRTEVHTAYAEGQPRFLCAQCKTPVFLAQRPAGPGVPRDGRAAFFKHFAQPDAPACACRTPASLRDVGAAQYDGAQEGLDHHTLKHALADCLRHDPRCSAVEVEKRIAGVDGDWRIPDVSTIFDGKRLAFDLQLATLPISTIRDRGEFYAANGVHHVWLTSADDLSRLSQQAFCDLHLNSGGRIFAIDDASIAACLRDGRLQLKELSIVPRLVEDRPIHNVWETVVAGGDVILMDPRKRRTEGERRYGQALADSAKASFGPQRQAIRRAAAMKYGIAQVSQQWKQISRIIRGSSEEMAVAHDVAAVLAFLAQVEICLNLTADQRPAAQPELQHRLQTLLATRSGLHWAPLVVQVFKTFPTIEAAIDAETLARLNALLTQTEAVRPLLRWHAGMLCALFPWLAFRLLVKAPKFGPNLRRPSSRA